MKQVSFNREFSGLQNKYKLSGPKIKSFGFICIKLVVTRTRVKQRKSAEEILLNNGLFNEG